MDLVTDLSSQAATFITVYQGILQISGDTFLSFRKADNQDDVTREVGEALNGNGQWLTLNQLKRIAELTGFDLIEELKDSGRADFSRHVYGFLSACRALVGWVSKCGSPANMDDADVNKLVKKCKESSSAYEWRCTIKAILYADTETRLTLVEILQYMPVQIIFCLYWNEDTPYRWLQVWKEPEEKSIEEPATQPEPELYHLAVKAAEANKQWWAKHWDINAARPIGQKGMFTRQSRDGEAGSDENTRSVLAKKLLVDDRELLRQLNNRQVPVPFESIFSDELNDIERSRSVRRAIDITPAAPDNDGGKEMPIDTESLWDGAAVKSRIKDPARRAGDMNLYALTFSGGGIRSATFNLGVLQRLAQLGVLQRFDYLSTVSGGGYIGSWFSSWVKRNGSMERVMDRLDPKKSTDPMADEVRPIRWLRMFSNYLSPNASIMSADAWTMGITWLRNTVINQIILLLLLCTALCTVGSVYKVWCRAMGNINSNMHWWAVFARSFGILILGAIIAGYGMRAFDPEKRLRRIGLRSAWLNDKFYWLLMAWGAVATFFVSAWLCKYGYSSMTTPLVIEKLSATGISGFMGFMLVAVIGRYHTCLPASTADGWFYFWLTVSSLCAAVCGVLLLTGSWAIFSYIIVAAGEADEFNRKLAFVVGVPLMLESISIIVVVRMAILGILFPDLRREWWGRMGAIVHRFIFLWILVAGAALILPELAKCWLPLITTKGLLAMVGGWGGIVGFAVKLASSSKTTGDKPTASNSAAAIDIFVRLAPYIFAAGFLLLGSFALEHIKSIREDDNWWQYLWLPLILAAVTAFLSYRVGVNEFSLHHFYRNRLTRAYLGATLRREVREKTANSFTGFDVKDDMLLKDLTTAQHYYGPFQVINTTLNCSAITDLDRQDRKGESFIFTPLYCGYDVCRNRPSVDTRTSIYEYGFRPTGEYAYPGEGPSLATAMTISGAAVSPNQGYHSSPATAFLMTLFNVRLGWWMGNTRKDTWKQSDPKFGIPYLVSDLIGQSNIDSKFVCLSDGGHFDNMGLYEMIRRQCRFIMVCDAEQDEQSTCEGFANAIRRCRIDFGVEIDICIDDITKKDPVTKFAAKHWVKGTIWYPGDGQRASGTLIYLKTSVTKDESVDIREYLMNNAAFPQESTADQFFDEQQFESYRKLGYSSI